MKISTKWFNSVLALGMLCILTSCNTKSHFHCFAEKPIANTKTMKVLKNDTLTIGILPDCGGNIVLVKPKGGYNLLFSDPATWHTDKTPKKDKSIFDWVKPVNGHTLWLGPESKWWTQQDIYPTKKAKKSTSPPDPYLAYGKYEIKKHTDTSIILKSPHSPVSGVSFEKHIHLTPDSKVLITYKMTNTSHKTVSWDMWSNTRFNGYATCYAPIEFKAHLNLDIDLWQPETRAPMVYDIIDHYFFFNPNVSIPGNKARRVSKAYLTLRQGKLFTFVGNWLFIKEADMTPKHKLHPEHTFAEIYQNVERRVKTSLLEVEMHSPLYTLKPGESATFNETWHILPYLGKASPEAQVDFLNQLEND